MLRLDITGYTEKEALLLILSGLEVRHTALSAKISELTAALGVKAAIKATARKVTPSKPAKPAPASLKPSVKPAVSARRAMSPEARARIVAAQKKRWANVNKAKRAAQRAAKPLAAKRTPHAKLDLAPVEPSTDGME